MSWSFMVAVWRTELTDSSNASAPAHLPRLLYPRQKLLPHRGLGTTWLVSRLQSRPCANDARQGSDDCPAPSAVFQRPPS
jgi:hypothetical protein